MLEDGINDWGGGVAKGDAVDVMVIVTAPAPLLDRVMTVTDVTGGGGVNSAVDGGGTTVVDGGEIITAGVVGAVEPGGVKVEKVMLVTNTVEGPG